MLAIEPDPTNCAMLQESRAYAPHVDILDVAVSLADGSATFLRDDVSGATGTLEHQQEAFNLRNYGETSQPMAVRTRSLDSVAQERGFPDFLKIDIEGHEAQALEGGAHLLARRPLILIEAFDPSSPALAQLRAAGYRLLGADSQGVIAMNRVSVNASITTVLSGSRGLSLLTFNDHAHFIGQAGLLTNR